MTQSQTATLIHIVLVSAQFLIPAFTPGWTVEQHTAVAGCLASVQMILGYGQSKMDTTTGNFPPSNKQ